MAETIENNVRKLIIDEQPINPKYYEKMSELLDALIKQRKQEALDYQKYLPSDRRTGKTGEEPDDRPGLSEIPQHPGQARACIDNLDRDEPLALAVDHAVRKSRQDDWREQYLQGQEGQVGDQSRARG